MGRRSASSYSAHEALLLRCRQARGRNSWTSPVASKAMQALSSCELKSRHGPRCGRIRRDEPLPEALLHSGEFSAQVFSHSAKLVWPVQSWTYFIAQPCGVHMDEQVQR